LDGSREITEFRAGQYVRMSTEHQQYSTHKRLIEKRREKGPKTGGDRPKLPNSDAGGGLLLDGNLRVLALKELGQDAAPAVDGREVDVKGARQPLFADTFVDGAAQHVIFLHRRKAADPVVVGLGLKILGDQAGINLLHGICPKAAELLQDHQFTPDVTRHLRKMKAARQIEAVELMIAANTITAAHADALPKATPPEQRTDNKPPQPEQPKGDPLEQIVKLEREMNQVQEKYKYAEENYEPELLNLVVAKGYLKKLMENEAVRSYVARHAPETLEPFELALNTVSMEEAVEQPEREDGPSAAEAAAQPQLAKDDSGATSDLGRNGQV